MMKMINFRQRASRASKAPTSLFSKVPFFIFTVFIALATQGYYPTTPLLESFCFFAVAQAPPSNDPPFTGSGAYSGIPLQFTPQFRGLHARHFVIEHNGDNAIRLTTALARNPMTGEPLPRRVTYGIAVAVTTPMFDYVMVNGRKIDRWVSLLRNVTAPPPTNTPIMVSTQEAFQGSPLNPFAGCQALMTAELTFEEYVDAGVPFDILVEFGPNAMLPGNGCATSAKYNILASGYIYTSEVPVFTPQYGYMYSLPNVTNDAEYAAAPLGPMPSAFYELHFNKFIGPVFFKPQKLRSGRQFVYGDAQQPKHVFPHPSQVPMRTFYAANMLPISPWFYEAAGGLLVGPTTTVTSAATCTVGTVYPYTARFIPANLFISLGAMYCGAFQTVGEIHAACNRRANCQGYSTRRIPIDAAGRDPITGEFRLWREVPLCLLVPLGLAPEDNPTPFDRMFHIRPQISEIPKCHFVTELSGTVAISIQQNGLASSFATVKVNGDEVARCGRETPFANMLPGANGACNTYLLCHVANVTAGAKVEVQMKVLGSDVDNGIRQFGCENGLGVMVEQISIDSVQRPTPRVPAYDVAHMLGRPNVDTNLGGVFTRKFFVYKATQMALTIPQTVHDCASREASDVLGIQCPTHTHEVAISTGVVQRCGARKGFYQGWMGRSDDCDTLYFCDDMMLFDAQHGGYEEGYTGQVTVTFNSAFIFYRSATCVVSIFGLHAFNNARNLSIAPWLADSNSEGVRIPVFPMLSTSDIALAQVHLVSPRILTKAELVAILGTENAEHLAAFASVKPFYNFPANGETLHAYYVDWPNIFAFLSNPRQGAYISPNSTYAVFMDIVATPRSLAQIDIPKGARRVRVSVAQIDATSPVTVMLGTATYGMEVVCGGENKYGFSDPAHAQCDTYYDCADMYFDPDVDFQHANQMYGRVTVFVTPQAQRSASPCSFEAAFKISFSDEAPPFAGCAADEFECPRERKCIKLTSVCDRIQDCFSNADEKQCARWTALPDETFCVDPVVVTKMTNFTFESCRQAAIAHGTTVFALLAEKDGDAPRICSLYRPDVAASLLQNPGPAACAAPSGSTLYMALGGSSSSSSSSSSPSSSQLVAQFGLCRSSLQCNSNGRAVVVPGGAGCVCECNEGFFGASCSEQVSLRPTVVSVGVNHYAQAGVLAVALALDQTTVAVSCTQGYYGINTIHPEYYGDAFKSRIFGFDCQVTSLRGLQSDVDAHFKLLQHSESLAAVSAKTSRFPGDDPIRTLSFRSSIANLVSIGECQPVMTGRFISSAHCQIRRNFDRLRLVFNSGIVADLNTITVTRTRTLPPSGAGHTFRPAAVETSVKEYNCTGSMTIDMTSLCVISACEIDISATNLEDGNTTMTLDVKVITAVQEFANTMDCFSDNVFPMGFVAAGNTPIHTNTTVEMKEEEYVGFLAGGIVVFAVGALITCLAAVFCWYRYTVHHRAETVGRITGLETLASELIKVKSTLLAEHAFEKKRVEEGRWGTDRVSIIFALTSLICVIGAITLLIVWGTGEGRSSNFRVLYEEYSDSLCTESYTAFMPTRVFAVPDGEYTCRQVLSTGEAVGVAFAAGECSGGEGDYTVRFRMAGSKTLCDDDNALKDYVARAGQCVPLSDIVPTADRSVFVKLSCSTAQQINARVGLLRQLTMPVDRFVTTTVADVDASLMLSSTAPTTGVARYFSNGAIHQIISSDPFVLDSQKQVDLVAFAFSFDPRRIVLQNYKCAFDTPTSGGGNEAEVCDSLSSDMGGVHAALLGGKGLGDTTIAPLLPLDAAAVPIGFIFNNYGTPLATTWDAAGHLSHKYYGAQGTLFDIGAHFPQIRDSPSDDEGYTIAMYLRADETTQGFAFAVCDAFENAFTGRVHPLHRLGEIITSGQTGEAWYKQEQQQANSPPPPSYRVYQSLFVNGPGSSLTFAYASPTLEEKVHTLGFDLAEIGMERVFNGLWHHVALSFIVENGRVRLQLIIDGETSYTKSGWSVCVGEFSEAIPEIGSAAPVYNVVEDAVKRGAMVVTGYLNGGVFAVKAYASAQPNTYFLQTGTQAMKDNNPFPRESTLILGIVLLSVAGIYLAILIAFAVHGIRKLVSSIRSRNGRDVAVKFYNYFVRIRKAQVNGTVDGSIIKMEDCDEEEKDTVTRFTISPTHKNGETDQEEKECFPTEAKDSSVLQKKTTTSIPNTADEAAFSEEEDKTDHTTAFTAISPIADSNPRGRTASDRQHVAIVVEKGFEEKHGQDDEKKKKKHSAGGSYLSQPLVEPIRITTALRWLGLSVDELSSVLDEVSAQTPSGVTSEALLLMLLLHRYSKEKNSDDNDNDNDNEDADGDKQKDKKKPHLNKEKDLFEKKSTFSVAEWNQMVLADADEQMKNTANNKKGSRSFFARLFGKDVQTDEEAEASLYDTHNGEKDLFLTMFRRGGRKSTVTAAEEPKTDAICENAETADSDVEMAERAHAYDADHTATMYGGDDANVTKQANKELSGGGAKGGAGGVGAGTGAGGGVTFDTIAPNEIRYPSFGSIFNIGSSSLVSTFLEFIAPVVMACQAVFVWTTSITFPLDYDNYFRGVFSFISIDFTTTFDELSTLATPLIQFFAGIVVVVLILYFLYADTIHFNSILTQYVWRRDALEGSTGEWADSKEGNGVGVPISAKFQETVTNDVDEANMLSDGPQKENTCTKEEAAAMETPAMLPLAPSGISLPEDMVASLSDPIAAVAGEPIRTLPVASALTIDVFRGVLKREDRPTHKDGDADEDEDGAAKKKKEEDEEEATPVVVQTDDGASLLVSLGETKMNEKDESSKKKKKNKGGKVMVVPLKTEDKKEDAEGVFEQPQPLPLEEVGIFCHRHPDQRLTPQLQNSIWPFTNAPTCCLMPNGDSCGEAHGLVYSCGLEYEDPATGEMRMCNYALCEKHARIGAVSSIIAMALSYLRRVRLNGFVWLLSALVVVAANAVYTPFMKTALMIVGCHPFYQCEFEHCWAKADQKYALAAFCSIVIIVLLGAGYPIALTYIIIIRKRRMNATFLAPEYKSKYATAEDSSQINDDELNRFVSTDSTALAQQYQQLHYRWLFFPIILIVYKIAQLIPAIFIEPRSFEQRLGCAVVQLISSLFMFATSTQLSPIVLITLRAAEVHNLVLLGLHNISLVVLNDSNTDMGAALVASTIVYLVFSAVFFVVTVIFPILVGIYTKSRLRKFLKKSKFNFTPSISIFKDPLVHPVSISEEKREIRTN